MKSIVEKSIKKYLPALKVERRSLKLKNLPAFYRGMYEFEQLNINERPFLVIKVKDTNLGPREFKKHSKLLKGKFNYPQIWYLRELHFNKVQRMIENEYNFIVEGKHVHFPALFTSINPTQEKTEPAATALTGMSVNILIREVLRKDISGKTRVEIANLFNTTKMTMSRAIKPLLANNLCSEDKVGVSKYIYFKDRSVLWEYVRDHVKTPVTEAIFIDKNPKALPFSGISALSNMSMLSDDEIKTFCSEKKAFNRKYTKTKPVMEDFAKSKVELWDRPPILTENNNINVIDTFLVNKDDSDERVQIELDNILRKYDLDLG